MSIYNFNKSHASHYFYTVNQTTLKGLFLNHFGHVANAEQAAFFEKLASFIYNPTEHCFILKGYAGTGKTTLIRSVAETYSLLNGSIFLLAPTGRAAKVLGQRSGKRASTIHRSIYMSSKDGAVSIFQLKKNNSRHALFVIDEASMISDKPGSTLDSGNSNLLEDLISFVRMGHKCKMLIIGDPAQLPPVGYTESPALDKKTLQDHYGLRVEEHQLTEVIRQSQESLILHNATSLRKLIAANSLRKPKIILGEDIIRLTDAYEMEEVFQYSFSDTSSENGIMVVYSNKRANQYNFDIRARILFRDDIIGSSDRLMVVKNNYFWLEDSSKMGFIANGDTLEVLSLRNREEVFGFTFTDATVQLTDYPDEPAIDVKLMLDVLQEDGPSLGIQKQKQLFDAVAAQWPEITQKKKILERVANDPYFNALQVKFSNVVTCHKAQGGQWPVVIIEQPYLPEGKITKDYLRWLYTALTRAQEKVYLVGFGSDFFDLEA